MRDALAGRKSVREPQEGKDFCVLIHIYEVCTTQRRQKPVWIIWAVETLPRFLFPVEINFPVQSRIDRYIFLFSYLDTSHHFEHIIFGRWPKMCTSPAGFIVLVVDSCCHWM